MTDKIQELRKELIDDMPDSWAYKEKVLFLLTELDAKEKENEQLKIGINQWKKEAHFQYRLHNERIIESREWKEKFFTSYEKSEELQHELETAKQENHQVMFALAEALEALEKIRTVYYDMDISDLNTIEKVRSIAEEALSTIRETNSLQPGSEEHRRKYGY